MDTRTVKKQQRFFNDLQHQYKQERIVHPPLHTQLEIEEILKRIKSSTQGHVADFGAGSGRVTIPLLRAGYKVYAIDISQASLKNLKSLADKLKLSALCTGFTFPSHLQFTSIVGADILHHVDLDEAIPRLWEALEPGGKAIFSEPCALNIAWYLYLSVCSDWSVETGILQCRYFHLIKKFKEYGFRAVAIQGLGFLPTPLFNWSKPLCIFNNRLGNIPLLKLFAYRFIIEAMK